MDKPLHLFIFLTCSHNSTRDKNHETRSRFSVSKKDSSFIKRSLWDDNFDLEFKIKISFFEFGDIDFI